MKITMINLKGNKTIIRNKMKIMDRIILIINLKLTKKTKTISKNKPKKTNIKINLTMFKMIKAQSSKYCLTKAQEGSKKI